MLVITTGSWLILGTSLAPKRTEKGPGFCWYDPRTRPKTYGYLRNFEASCILTVLILTKGSSKHDIAVLPRSIPSMNPGRRGNSRFDLISAHRRNRGQGLFRYYSTCPNPLAMSHHGTQTIIALTVILLTAKAEKAESAKGNRRITWPEQNRVPCNTYNRGVTT